METKPVITCLKTLLVVYSFVFWVSDAALESGLSRCARADYLLVSLSINTLTVMSRDCDCWINKRAARETGTSALVIERYCVRFIKKKKKMFCRITIGVGS